MKRRMNQFFSILLVLCMIISMMPAAALAASTPATLYLKPNSNWLVDNARFAAYFFNGSGDTWVSMTDSDGDGVYEATVPSGYGNVIFCRMNPSSTANNWDNKWNQSADLTIPTDGKNCYTVAAGAWDNGDGSWSTYSNVVEYYLFGFINGKNYACEEDSANVGTYKFVDGKLTATFTSDSYVGIKTGDNANWYMTKAYVSDSTGTFYNTSTGAAEKMFVPGGAKVTFTLTVNSDGTLTLSYSVDTSSCKHLNHSTDGICYACNKLVGHSWSGSECTVCGTSCSHSWSDGVCGICGISCSHSWGSGTVTKKATCTASGTRTYTCSTCADTKTETIPATGHSYKATVTKPTCTTPGYTTHTCSSCGDSYQDSTTAATGHSYNSSGVCSNCGTGCSHSWDSGKVTTAAGCTTAGVRTYTCSKCGSTKTSSISATGHSYKSVVTAPTCTDGGYTTYTCSTCGDSYTGDNTAATGHSYSGGKCTVCGLAQTYYLFGFINGANYACEEDAANLGIYKFVNGKLTVTFDSDSYVAVKTGDNASWYMTDGYPGDSATSATLYNTNSGIEVNKLRVPGGTEVTFTLTVNSNDTLKLSYQIVSCSHSYTSKVTTEATCTGTGVKTYTCSICGNSYTETIAAKGHSYKSVVTAPTCTDGGYTTYTCSTCGDSYTGDNTAATGHSYSGGKCTVCGLAQTYYLFGFINGANYACEEDAANLGIYKFVNGKLTVTFDSDSYVAVKTGDNASWYMTDGYPGDSATSATLYNTNSGIEVNKLRVPGGTEVTFTLTVNSNDTLKLSYQIVSCSHSYTSKVTTEATCTGTGVKTYTCSICGNSYTETIAAKGHSYKSVVTAPTCTDGGYTTYTCSTCGDSYTGDNTAATGHSYSGGKCTVCGASDGSGDVTTGNTWVKVELSDITASDTIAITMTKDGTTWALYNGNGTGSAPTAVVVTVNGNSMTSSTTEDISWNISNNDGSLIIYVAGNTAKWLYSTNSNNGVRVGTSANKTWAVDTATGYLKNTATTSARYLGVYNSTDWRAYTNTTGNTANQTLSFWKLSAAGDGSCVHSYESVVTAPTCTAGGYTTYTCSKCGDSYIGDNTAATGHSYSGGKCTVCGAADPDYSVDYYLIGYINGANYGCEEDSANLGSYKFVDGKLSATFDINSYVFIKTGDNAKWYMCDGYSEAASVTLYNTGSGIASPDKLFVPGGVEITFTLTVNADDTLTLSYVTAGCVHSYESVVTAPTCTAGGYTTYTCSKCGDSYTGDNTAATGHNYVGGSCQNCGDGCSHSYTCVTTAASCTAAGSKVYTCSKCGYSYTETIAALGHNYVNGTCSTCGSTTNGITVHLVNTLGWSGAVAYAWEGSTSAALSGWGWPGQIIQRDAQGYYTFTIDYTPASGKSLGLLFHNFNGSQTADLEINYATLSASREIWVKPSNVANSEGKFECSVATSEDGLVISPEINGKQVTFRYENASASKVYLAGSMNNWSTSANKMTKGSDGVWSLTLTLTPGVYEYKFVVDGEWILDPSNGVTGGYDGNSVLVVPSDDTTTNTGKVTVVLHFYKSTGDYTGWDVWFWDSETSGSAAFQTLSGDKGVIATYTVDGGTNTKLNYIVRKSDWSDQEFYDRSIDLSDVVSGTVHYYLNSGVATGSRVLGEDVVFAAKPNYASYNYDADTVWLKTSLPLNNVLAGSFSIVDGSGNATNVTVTGVEAGNGGYVLSLSRSLSLSELNTYQLKYGSLYLTIILSAHDMFYSSKFASEYTYYGDDLGATWSKASTTFKVWAPTAKAVSVKLYTTGNYGADDLIKTVAMTRGEKGVWYVKVTGDLNGVYYNYNVEFATYSVEATDPYTRATGANGDRGMVIDLDSTDPDGWDNDVSPNQGMSYTDAIIYELHVREMTIDSSSGVKDEWKGKYLGLTQSGTNYNGYSTVLEHIKELGVTHVQLMPVYDFSSVDEYHLNDWSQYAWGYDPKNYNVPEGSYSTDPFNGEVRIGEFKEMVQTFHENGINVVMDVVYNHTFDGGNYCGNKIVPNYYSRFYGEGNWSNGSGCGNDFATERSMVRNYIVDSILYWAEEYHIDGFRFDLVGLIDTVTINEIVNTVHAKYPYIMFYGEGWAPGGTAVEYGYNLTTQGNAWEVGGFGFFNDSIRNAIAGDNGNSWGFASGSGDFADALGNYFRASNGWSTSPSQTINYVSCHDNYCLMDKLCISRNGAYWSELAAMNRLSTAMVMMAQGTPFFLAGDELLREKKDSNGNRYDNGYGSTDEVSKITWSDLQNKEQAQLTDDYYAGLVEFRKNHAALRCPGGGDAWNYTTYHKINNNCIMFYVNGYPNYECSDGIVMIFNGSGSTQWVNIYDYGVPTGTWQACIHGSQAGVTPLWSTDNGSVGVEAYSATVLVLGDLVHEESVYNNQPSNCAHSAHNTSGLCTSCGTGVAHTYSGGKCSVCGLSQNAPSTNTIYFDNSATGWSEVNVYAWTEAGGRTVTYTGSWPGSAMTAVGDNVYAYALPIGATNVIFNDGGSNQSAGVAVPSYTTGLNYYSGDTWTTYAKACDHATHGTDGNCTNCGVAVEHTYSNGKCTGCGLVCDHTWRNGTCYTCGMVCNHPGHDTTGGCSVCGIPMEHSYSDGVCSGCGKVCGHNWNEGVCSICSVCCGHTSHTTSGLCTACGLDTGHSYSGGKCSICGLAEDAPGTITIYFDNTETEWTDVYVYAWTEAGGRTVTYSDAWPGTAMTKVSGSVYSVTLSRNASVVIFNDGSGSQTGNLSVPAYTTGLNYYKSNTWTAYGGECAHSYTGVVTKPTCTTGGYTTYTCSKCGDSYIGNTTASTGHSYVNGKCSSCGAAQAHTHSYTSVVTKPTCTTGGYTTYTCACGDSYTGNTTAATGHSYKSTVTAPTCTAAGSTVYTCSACRDSYTQTTAATGHSYVNGKCSACGAAAPTVDKPLAEFVQDGTTLQCWNWSMANIEANMGLIANMGYTSIQLSPIQEIKEGTTNKPYDNWWVLYQPISFKLNESEGHCVGTRDEFISLCETAHKYGIKVIVDVVSNHLANNGANTLSPMIDPDILYDSECWHDYTTNSWDYTDRFNITQYCMAGLPDLNTGSDKVQRYVLDYLKDLIDCGADGFRFDAAKQIETPSDNSSFASDFWPTVVNGAYDYASSTRGIYLYCYGEMLQNPDDGGQLHISAYTQFMSVTENVWSNDVRNFLYNGNAGSIQFSYFKNCNADKLVLWPESHDTFADHSSNYVPQDVLNRTWAIVAARAYTMALYFPRAGSMSGQELGEIAKTGWSSKEVQAVNRFHNAFIGTSEYCATYDSYAYVERGGAGVIIVSSSTGSGWVSVPNHTLAVGTYVDQITGNTFTVSADGWIYGDMGSTGIAVIHNPAKLNCSHPSHGSDGYCYDCFEYVGHSSGSTCSVCGTASTRTIYFKNTDGWSKVYLYAWHDQGDAVTAEWPGNAMTLVEGTTDLYAITVPVSATNVIFNNGGSIQTGNIVPSAQGNLYDYATGFWYVKGESTTADAYYLFGSINGVDYNGFNYKFTDGTMTVTFTADSYVFVCDSNGVEYMTEGWLGVVKSATMYNVTGLTTPDKLYIPGGVEVTITLIPNSNGSVTVSYVTAACNHSYSSVVTAPTCTTEGYTTYTCSNCGDSYIGNTVAASGHRYNGVVNTAPGCTTQGKKTFTCSVCGDSYTEGMAATGHSYNAVVTAPTCTAGGYTTYTCSSCGDSYIGNTVSAAGHNYVDGICSGCGIYDTTGCTHEYQAAVTDATCTTNATTTYTCKLCGHSYTTDSDAASNWTDTTPDGVEETDVETKTQYSYSELETTTSYESSLDGYEQTGSTVVETPGSVDYVAQWPSGFDTSSDLYNQYNNTPVADGGVSTYSTALRTAARTTSNSGSSTVVNSDKLIGYIYYHWHSDSISYYSTAEKTGTYTHFCAYYDTTDPDSYYCDTSDMSYKAGYDHCSQSPYFFVVEVYEQSYTTYNTLYSYERWTEASAWSDEQIEASDTRKVFTKQVYRYVNELLAAHVYTDIVTAPTCSSAGYTTHICFDCGHSYTDSIVSATAHNYRSVTTTPTCTSGGYTTHTCADCGYSYVGNNVAACGHDFDVNVTAPTCTESGYSTYTCKHCDYSYQGSTVATTGHSYKSMVTAPTCSTAGSTVYTCSTCGDSYTGNAVSATGHTYSCVTTNATCTQNGSKVYTCSGCGDSYSETIPASGHSYENGKCTVCGASDGSGDVITGDTWTKVALSDITASDIIAITMTLDGTTWALFNGSGTGSAPTAIAVTVNGNTMTGGTTADISWNISNDNGTLTIYVAGSTAKWLYSTNSNNGVRVGTSANKTWMVDADTGYLKNTATTSIRYLGVYDGADWRTYTNTTGNIANQTLTFWKLTASEETCAHSYESVVTAPTCTTGGYTTYTCSKCGDSYTDSEVSALGHSYENGSCTVCGEADPNYNPVVKPAFTVLSKTLNLEGEVKYNMIFMANNTSSVKNMGLLTFLSNPSDISIDSADYVIPGAVSASGMYMVGSQGIPAKNLGDTLYMVIYAELTDGSYAYSSVVPYSAKDYAYAQLGNSGITENQRKLLVAMLNYGAEAQLAFGYNTDNLINADLAAMEIPEMVTYSNDLLDGCVSADSTKTGNFPTGGFYMNSATVSLEGALAINYLLMPANTPANGMKVYYWTAETYNSVDALTVENADGTLDSIVSSGMYMATYNGLAASQMGDTVYVAAVYENGGNTYTTGVISYSLAKYLTATADGTGTQKNLAAATVIYGYYANIEFPNV